MKFRIKANQRVYFDQVLEVEEDDEMFDEIKLALEKVESERASEKDYKMLYEMINFQDVIDWDEIDPDEVEVEIVEKSKET